MSEGIKCQYKHFGKELCGETEEKHDVYFHEFQPTPSSPLTTAQEVSLIEREQKREQVTDETVIAEVCSNECMPERNYHLNEIGVVVKDLYPQFRTQLLTYAEVAKKAEEMEGHWRRVSKELMEASQVKTEIVAKAKAWDELKVFLESTKGVYGHFPTTTHNLIIQRMTELEGK